jgi:hypothetical protein
MSLITDTTLSQYANSPILLALMQMFDDSINPINDINNFYTNVWNVDTATGYGLDMWGRRVNVSRTVTLVGGNYFGFAEAADAASFNSEPFFSGVPATLNYVLSDDAYRLLIMVKALSNISRCSVSVYNQILRQLFPGRGNAYVSDNGNMAARLSFEFALAPFEISVLKQSAAFSNPTGVKFDIMITEQSTTFGFGNVADSAGFNQGVFFGGFA